MKFLLIVDKVLELKKANSVERFRLKCNQTYAHGCIDRWICSVINQNLQEVHISISEEEFRSKQEAEEDLLKLPNNLFLVGKLKILKLHGKIIVDIARPVCLPSLKILHLVKVRFENIDSCRWLISDCPNLEELRIDLIISPQHMVNFNISISKLKDLYLYLLPSDFNNPPETKIEINAPSLKYLNFSTYGHDPLQCFDENFPCLVRANIFFGSVCSVTRLLKTFKNVEYFKLNLRCPLKVPARDFPSFVNLTQLVLLGKIPLSWDMLLLFLESSPKLETLLLRCEISISDAAGSQSTEPKLIPTCFSSLVKASFIVYKVLNGEEVIEYFLKNASVMEEIEVNIEILPEEPPFVRRLLDVPRSSAACLLIFRSLVFYD
ncbi:hypothetical protein DITRI_Ditri01bG0151500 [Diplodiscus trichospermus]